jgi:predicted nuclease with TOPRIM domain
MVKFLNSELAKAEAEQEAQQGNSELETLQAENQRLQRQILAYRSEWERYALRCAELELRLKLADVAVNTEAVDLEALAEQVAQRIRREFEA